MARLISTEQLAVLNSPDRTTYVRVKIEDPDGTMQDVTSLNGANFLNECTIEHSTDYPVSSATIALWRRVGDQSLAPLIEESRANRDQYANYAPFLNPHRQVTVEIASLHAMFPVTSSDWIELWKGAIDEVQWGGFPSRVVIRCRDILADLNDTIIETTGTYGHDGTLPNIATVSQEILDDNETGLTLAVPEVVAFGIYEYELGNVSVLDGLKALADLPGANLHMRWSDIAAEHQLTLWMPDRDATAADWTIGPEDYYDVQRLDLSLAGIRNVVDVVYTDTNGTEQTEQASDGASIAFYGRRFMRIDARGTSITSSGQASSLATSLVSDLALPPAVQEIESAFWWPLELGDMVTYSANGEHYDSDQTWATFAYRHVLSPDKCRTFITARGQPSGGYARWHGVEQAAAFTDAQVTACTIALDEDGTAVVTVQGDAGTAQVYVTAADGEDPADPTKLNYDGLVSSRNGTVDTGVTITAGERAHVKVRSADASGALGPAQTYRSVRRLGLFHQDASTGRSHTGDTTYTAVETVEIPALFQSGVGAMAARVKGVFLLAGSGGTKNVRVRYDGGVAAHAVNSIASGDQNVTLEAVIRAAGATTFQSTYIDPLVTGFGGVIDSPRTVNVAADITWEVQLADAGDTATLVLSEIEWIGNL